MAEKYFRRAPDLFIVETEFGEKAGEFCIGEQEFCTLEPELCPRDPENCMDLMLEKEAPGLLIDPEQPLLPEIGRELCRVRDSDVKGKQGSGKAHVIRTYSRDIGRDLGTTGYTPDRGELRGYRQDILTENLAERESTFPVM